MDGSAEDRARQFDRLAEEFCGEPGVETGTMMGFPCLRVNGKFFATKERTTGKLIVKLPAEAVNDLIERGEADSFAPAGKVFREWAEVVGSGENEWRSLLTRAKDFVAGCGG